jgi:hypothetical protein
MHEDLTFDTGFVPGIWFQVPGFGCQEGESLNPETLSF